MKVGLAIAIQLSCLSDCCRKERLCISLSVNRTRITYGNDRRAFVSIASCFACTTFDIDASITSSLTKAVLKFSWRSCHF